MPDTDLIAKIARGQQASLGALYDRHAGLLLAVLTRILGDNQEAEDVLHEVFLEVWQRAADYDSQRGSVRAWLVMRARSRGLDRARALGRARALPTEGLSVEGPPLPPPAEAIRQWNIDETTAAELQQRGTYLHVTEIRIAN